MSRKILFIFYAFLFILIFAVSFSIATFLIKSISKDDSGGKCKISEQIEIVRGNSMEPLVKNGSAVKILFNYYKCNPIKRDDIVIYNYSAKGKYLIKRIAGIQGDSFKINKTGSCDRILINNKVLANSALKQYCLSKRQSSLLELYQEDYSGKIPENSYFIIGDNTFNSLDSTHFGFISGESIIGKVLVNFSHATNFYHLLLQTNFKNLY